MPLLGRLWTWARRRWHARLRLLDQRLLFPTMFEAAHKKHANWWQAEGLARRCISLHIRIEPHWQRPEEWSAAEHEFVTNIIGEDQCR